MTKKYKPKTTEYNNSYEAKQGLYFGLLRPRKKKNKIYNKKVLKLKQLKPRPALYWQISWSLQASLSERHVLDFRKMLAINETSIRNLDSEYSFIRSKFYLKKVFRVDIFPDYVVLSLSNIEQNATPTYYICYRLKSFGDQMLYDLANSIERLSEKNTLNRINDTYDVYRVETLSCLDCLKGRMFISQFSPSLFAISRSLLELLGHKVEQFALECTKYQTVLYEFFSAQKYAEIIRKHVENLLLLEEYTSGRMTITDFCDKTMISFVDEIITRSHNRLKCQFYAGTCEKLIPYIEVRPIKDSQDRQRRRGDADVCEQKLRKYCLEHTDKEINLLKQLIHVPDGFLPENRNRICGFQQMDIEY